MSAPEHTHRHPALTFGVGLVFVLVGAALLVQELGLFVLGWSVVLPAVLVVGGVGIAVAGAVGAARSRADGR